VSRSSLRRRHSYATRNDKEERVAARLTYTVPEVAELLGISRSSAYECVRRGEIPALTLGRRVVIAKATIDTILNASTNHVTNDDIAR
jgi:excisionase family DNA binding protein